MDWQPIETAPMDGVISVYMDGDVLMGMRIFPCFMKGGRPWVIGSVFAGDLPEKPTHWMPLPEPPK